MKNIKRITAVVCSAVMLFSLAACSSKDKEKQTAKVTAQDISPQIPASLPAPISHGLMDIVLLSSVRPLSTSLPDTRPVSEENKNLYFILSNSLSGFVIRDWNCTDLSVYKENGFLELDVKGKGNKSGEFEIGVGEMINGEYIQTTAKHKVELSDEWTTVRLPLSSIDSDFKNVRDFLIGNTTDVVYASNIKISSPDSERIYPAIKVNQAGYKPENKKTALVSGFADVIDFDSETEFELVNASDETVSFTGKLTLINGNDRAYSGEAVYQADFSNFKTEGTYYIRLKNSSAEASLNFKISKNVYDDVLADTQRYYYYQRANCEITSDYGEGFSRSDVTPEDFALPLQNDKSQKIDVSGGWYDAGDVGKYVSPGATAVNSLLWAYLINPESFSDGQSNIPESGNGIPDILDEVKYELDFFLKMQDKSSGGFYMKAKSASSDDNTNDRVVWEATANSTADCVAVLSFASKIYEKYDRAYAQRLLEAAESGWAFVEKNPDLFVNTTYCGEDNSNSTFWAAGCMFYATGEEKYNDYFKKNYAQYISCFDNTNDCHTVGKMGIYGYFAYLLSENADESVKKEVSEKFGQWQQGVISRIRANCWSVAVSEWSFWWGSFNTVLGNAQDMTVGCYVTGGNSATANAVCQAAVDFILGENPLRKSFVTGSGEDAIKCTFSSFYPSIENGFPDGYMPGGINSSEGKMISRFPMKCYNDTSFDWVTNENSVYWNAVMVFNLAQVK